jgi:hypothetical protein
VGWDRSEEGAAAAGLAYAAAEQAWLYLRVTDVAESVAAIATTDAAPRLSREVTGQVRLLRDALAASGGPVWWLVRPLAERVVSYSRDRATVAVWVVAVLSATGVAAPQCRWAIDTVELAWVSGDWRVEGIVSRPGPTPVLDASDEPWAAAELADALAGFAPLGVGG